MSSNNSDGSSCINFQAVCRKQMFVKQQKIKHKVTQSGLLVVPTGRSAKAP